MGGIDLVGGRRLGPMAWIGGIPRPKYRLDPLNLSPISPHEQPVVGTPSPGTANAAGGPHIAG